MGRVYGVVKVWEMGNSIVMVIPKEAVREFEVKAGDRLQVVGEGKDLIYRRTE